MTPEQRVAHAAYMREWREKHPENREYQRTYFAGWATEEKRQQMRERTKAWRLAHPTQVRDDRRAQRARRRALKLASAIGPIDFNQLLEQAAGVCAICAEPLEGEWHFDHIIPLAKGGPHTQDNLQVTHPLCNKRKAASMPAGYK